MSVHYGLLSSQPFGRRMDESTERAANCAGYDRPFLQAAPPIRSALLAMLRTPRIRGRALGEVPVWGQEAHMPNVQHPLLRSGDEGKDCGGHEVLRASHDLSSSPHGDASPASHEKAVQVGWRQRLTAAVQPQCLPAEPCCALLRSTPSMIVRQERAWDFGNDLRKEAACLIRRSVL